MICLNFVHLRHFVYLITLSMWPEINFDLLNVLRIEFIRRIRMEQTSVFMTYLKKR